MNRVHRVLRDRLSGFDIEFCQQFADLVVYDAGSLLLRVAHARAQRVDSLRESLQVRLGDVEPGLSVLLGVCVVNRHYCGAPWCPTDTIAGPPSISAGPTPSIVPDRHLLRALSVQRFYRHYTGHRHYSTGTIEGPLLYRRYLPAIALFSFFLFCFTHSIMVYSLPRYGYY